MLRGPFIREPEYTRHSWSEPGLHRGAARRQVNRAALSSIGPSKTLVTTAPMAATRRHDAWRTLSLDRREVYRRDEGAA
jgi:hypothetical protein